MENIKLIVLAFFFLAVSITIRAQRIYGHITDAETGEDIPYATVSYKGYNEATAANQDGRYSIAKHEERRLTFSSIGYKDYTIDITTSTPLQIDIKLNRENKDLNEIKVKVKRQRYSRKNNPAVDLMRKVIERKKLTNLSNKDYYCYDKYQKLTLALNDVSSETLQWPIFQRHSWLREQVELCPYNNKLILPLSVDETVTEEIYRKDPHSQKTIVKGSTSTGIADLIETGNIITVGMHDAFTDVNIYDDQIRLLQHPFTSPIGKDAISFYRYYIIDTLLIEKDSCIHLHFIPNNQQDFSFRGDLFILKDSSYQVKRCELTIPTRTDVNFVDNVRILQEFDCLDDSLWVLVADDMIAEMKLTEWIQKVVVIRNTRLSNYEFSPLPEKLFKGKTRKETAADAMIKDEDFWNKYRGVDLSKGEKQMSSFLQHITELKGYNYVIFFAKALIENYVETNKPSKIDIGPINTILTSNFIDGFRTRLSAFTTANLNPKLFLSGYYARGWGSKKNYYRGDFTWSFNKKAYLPDEFPVRTLSFESTYDVCSPSDKFLQTDKDNVFSSFKWTEVNEMMFYNKQQLTFTYELEWFLKTTFWIKTEENEACGNLLFTPLSFASSNRSSNSTESNQSEQQGESTTINYPKSIKIRTTELHAELRYAPEETYVNTKQHRITINHDAPVFTLAHTTGVKGLLKGDYDYNFTELSIYKRFWVNSWGKIDCRFYVGIQWNKVPFPLLCMPRNNLSYITQGYTFELINNMEFLNDRYAYAIISWDLNGKIFNRIPLIKRFKWREWLVFRCMWGTLTDKNNPFLPKNAGDNILMEFPEGAYLMNSKKPYVEFSVGIHNIFKILHVEYVRRVNYLYLPTAQKHGIKFIFKVSF